MEREAALGLVTPLRETDFAGGRHRRRVESRVEKIAGVERHVGDLAEEGGHE